VAKLIRQKYVPEDRLAIRAELFSAERLESHARSLAKAQTVNRHAPYRRPLPKRLKENASILEKAMSVLAAAARGKKPMTPAGEWLLDNYHVVEEQIREIKNDLPADYYHELPKLADGPLAGYPRVYAITWAIVAHTDSAFELDHLTRVVNSYQQVSPLTIGELWAIPVTLRITLVENLCRMAQETLARAEAAERADMLADRILQTASDDELEVARELRELESSPTFPAHLARLEQRLRDHPVRTASILRWINRRLSAAGSASDQVIRAEHDGQSAANVTVRNIITSMRLVSNIDWSEFVESVSLVDRIIEGAVDFRAMEFSTRNRYRRAIETLALGADRLEAEVAEAAVGEANAAAQRGASARECDPGYYLISKGRCRLEKIIGYRAPWQAALQRGVVATGLSGYLGAIAVVCALLIALFAWKLGDVVAGWRLFDVVGLAVLPASEIAITLVNRLVSERWDPACLPGMALRDGVPDSASTALVMPVLLSNEAEIDQHVRQLEVHFLSNGEDNLIFALLSDWCDADSETMPDDARLLDYARDRIAALNRTHQMTSGKSRFHLLHRRRRWNPAQGKWMGWERKRGKLHEFNRLLRGATDTSFLAVDDFSAVASGKVRYVITLDADTRLPRGAAKKLIGKMCHVLNAPRIDPACGQVVEGYGIMQPRVTPSLPVGSTGSLFQWAFSGPNGLDPYAFAVSDVYQDLFEQGSFVGKGIYDVDAFEAALAGRIPENAVLSHDLLEGAHARAALVTDVEVVEEFPSRYDIELSRQHRWIRGDWQLLPWIFSRKKGISALDRWKMLENLRRSLTGPVLLLGFLWGWTLPFDDSLAWTCFLLTAIALPPLLPLVIAVLPHRVRQSWRAHYRFLSRDALLAAIQVLFVISFLARQAWLTLDAVCRTLFRLFISRRQMLEWVTFAHAAYSRRADLGGLALQMTGSLAFMIAAGVSIAAFHATAWNIAGPFLVLWGFSPLIARYASVTPPAEPLVNLSHAERQDLRLIARRTWRFFETFVTDAENMLPPDNFQEDPGPFVAHRTSPTNIGLYLLSVVSARDFGWIDLRDAVERLEGTLASMGRLERYSGHFLNWYDTQNLRALTPRYVSSVDSGNLAAHLLVLKNVCREWIQEPAGRWPWFAGAADALALLRCALREGGKRASDGELAIQLDEFARILEKPAPTSVEIAAKFSELETQEQCIFSVLRRAYDQDETSEIFVWAEALQRSLDRRRDLAIFTGAFPQSAAPSLAGADTDEARELRTRINSIAVQAERFADQMDFRFLYDERRKFLVIGFRVEDKSLDDNYYDLLASEARLASFFAIAKGDVPTRHWFQLGRTLTPIKRGAALLSWSGSMFEYLMPSLVLREPQGSLLAQSNRLAVQRHIRYGAKHGTPWGISESQFYARDRDQNYQYAGFGVSDLGLKLGLSESLVIAPYATGLAAMVDPSAAIRNYAALTALGARGRFGWYEAVDFTRARLSGSERFAIVRSYMAHHQAMTILAIANIVHDGSLQQRFHADPMVQATELLLQERVPRDVRLARPPSEFTSGAVLFYHAIPPMERRIVTPHTAIPRIHLLSNGRLACMVTAAGSGRTMWRDIAVTRWREDPTRDQWGTYIYLRDTRSGAAWSAGFQPCGVEASEYEAIFAEDRATIVRTDFGLTAKLEITVSPEDDAEIRRVSITNNGGRVREIEVTSFAELALARPADDAAHPAFSKLFIETEYVRNLGALLATRRPRDPEDSRLWAAHLTVVEGGESSGDLQYETDRSRFLGRNRTTRRPAAVSEGWPLSNTAGVVLDPIFSIRRRVRIPPGQTVCVSFWTMVAGSRDDIIALADKHREAPAYSRAMTLAATRAKALLDYLNITAEEAHLFQSLASYVLYSHASMRSQPELLRTAGRPISDLWQLGISGDLPIVLLIIDAPEDMDIARQLIRAHEYWKAKSLAADIVILNDRPVSYDQELQASLGMLVHAAPGGDRTQEERSRGNLYLVRSDILNQDMRRFLQYAARVVLSGRRGSLSDQLRRAMRERTVAITPRKGPRTRPATVAAVPPTSGHLSYFNGLGGFSEGGQEYVTILKPDMNTPAPWVNVIANAEFGFQVSTEGAGFTWAINSQQNQITAWSNDPVGNETAEAIYICDLDSGEVWSPTASPFRDKEGTYVARHGQGYSIFEYESRGIALELLQFVALNDPIKISHLKIVNRSGRPRRLSVTAYVEWTLGAHRAASAPYIMTERDVECGALFARNPWNSDFGKRVAFLDMGGRQQDWTCDRAEFLGRNGAMQRPALLASDGVASGAAGVGLDPCAVLQAKIALKTGSEDDVTVFLGQEVNEDQARALLARYRAADWRPELKKARAFWDETLGTLTVRTPDPAMDMMLNRWLLYQTLSCRVWGRAGFYQASGAYGFRDQLQDVMALCLSRPELAREHILRAAERQFLEGDVQHWWLPESGKGIRTHISDDMAWLAFVTIHYVEVTGDATVLDETLPFLEDAAVPEGHADAFLLPAVSQQSASLYEHCARALDASMKVGSHGLPLIGTGDWNDGMNRVGADGKGESVWLGWFLYATLERFSKFAESRRDSERWANWVVRMTAIKDALEEHGWDGDWYLRAYFDDGSPLGSASNRECRIDSISQSWSVISGAARPDRAARAMEALDKYLVRAEDRLTCLFAPPFAQTDRDPGYIKGYPPGVRENGGHYAHAVTWAVMANAMLGKGDKAAELFSMLNPVNHTRNLAQAERYKLEPYVACGDIYSVAPHIGRGGWSWYTGSAGWTYRVGIEYILGLRIHGSVLMIDPCIPSSWPGFEARLAYEGTIYDIAVENPNRMSGGIAELVVDGKVQDPAKPIALESNRGNCRIRVVLGTAVLVREEEMVSGALDH